MRPMIRCGRNSKLPCTRPLGINLHASSVSSSLEHPLGSAQVQLTGPDLSQLSGSEYGGNASPDAIATLSPNFKVWDILIRSGRLSCREHQYTPPRY